MPSRISRVALIACTGVAMAIAACAAPPARSAEMAGAQRRDTTFLRPLYGPTWTLLQLRGASAPAGAGGQPATLIFYSGSERSAAGFAGCNRWSSTYALNAPDSVAFSAPISTKMACDQGMQLERDFLSFIERASRIGRRDSTLVLRTPTGDSAIFVARD